MVKKGPPRSLSVVVDPSHKLIVDDTDRPRTGRLILDGTTHPNGSQQHFPASPAPGAPFNLNMGPSTEGAARSSLSLGRSLTRRPSSLAVQHTTISSPDDAMDIEAPPSPALQTSPSEASPLEIGQSNIPAMPSLQPAVSSLAARRRSSVPCLPAPPPIGLSGVRLPSRGRNDSGASINSLQLNRSRATSITRPDDPNAKFTYLNSAASSASNTALNNITVPAPYRGGPIEVLPGIWLGCEENAKDWESLKRCGIGSILNVAKEIVNLFGESETKGPTAVPAPLAVQSNTSTPDLGLSKLQTHFGPQLAAATFYPADSITGRPDLHYLHLPWSHGQSDLVENGFAQAMQFCDEATSRGQGVLVHCQCGVSRSATLVIAMVMRAASRPDAADELKALGPSMNAAYDYVKRKSACVGPNMSLIYQLLEYEKKLHPRASLSRTTSGHYRSGSEASSSEPADSPDEPSRYMSEEERIREEEEEWARMRRQLEEEEERERQESLRAAGAHPGSAFGSGLHQAESTSATSDDSLAVPWHRGWPGFPASSSSRPAARSQSVKSVADDEEAIGLDRAMEERQLRRKSSAISVASSCGSSNGLGAPGLLSGNVSAPFAAWKARFGHGKRVRAGSVESNVTGRSVSMVSVEEVDEPMVEGEHQQMVIQEEHPAQSAESNHLMEQDDNQTKWSTIAEAPRPLSEVSTDSKSFFSSATDSASISEMSMSDDVASPAGEDDDSAEQYLTAPPLSADATSTSLTSPATPVSFNLPKKSGAQLSPLTEISDGLVEVEPSPMEGFQSFRIVVEDATPMASRLTYGHDLPTSPTPLRSSKLARSMTSPMAFNFSPLDVGLDKSIPPPSASAHKTSFGSDDLRFTPPPPSASHVKLSFGVDTSLPFPRRSSSAAGRRPSVENQREGDKRSRSRSPLRLPLMQRKLSRRQAPVLEAVPGSPTASRGLDPVSNRLREALSTPIAPSISLQPGDIKSNNGQFGQRKRSKSKPQPLALSSQGESQSGMSLASYVLSTSKRKTRSGKSSSSNSSVSSASSTGSSLRSQVLSRFTRTNSQSPQRPSSPPLGTATPHQTLFIFPPSSESASACSSNSSGPPLPSSTPSAFVLTTNFPQGGGPSSMLTPTPTLATFLTTTERRTNGPTLSRKSSISSTSSLPGNGWMGTVPSTPTTACSRVDARAYITR